MRRSHSDRGADWRDGARDGGKTVMHEIPAWVAHASRVLATAALNFLAFWRFGPQPAPPTGVLVTIFAIGIAAAEAAVGLALVIAVYRHYRTINVDQIDQLKG